MRLELERFPLAQLEINNESVRVCVWGGVGTGGGGLHCSQPNSVSTSCSVPIILYHHVQRQLFNLPVEDRGQSYLWLIHNHNIEPFLEWCNK